MNAYEAQPGSFLLGTRPAPGPAHVLYCPVDGCGWKREVAGHTLDAFEFEALSHLLDAHR